jgi:ATP-binding cassette subfamily B protein
MSTETQSPLRPNETPKAPVKETVGRMWRVYGSILEMAWAVAKARSVALATCMFLIGLAGAVQGFLLGQVTDALAAPSRALTYGITFLAFVVTSRLLLEVLQLLQFDMGDRITQEVERRIMLIVAGSPGLDHLERSEFADKIKLVREQSYIPFSALASVNSLVYMFCGLTAALVLLGSIHPLLLLLPVIAVPSSIIQFRVFRKHFAKFDETAPEDRLASHYMSLLTTPESAKEVRLFGLGAELVARHKDVTEGYIRKLFRDRFKRSAIGIVIGAMHGLALAGSIGFIGWLALRGRASMGQVVMGVSVARMVIGHVEMATSTFAWLAELSLVGERYLWMLNYRSQVEVLPRDEIVPVPERIVDGIRIEDVSFAYPGTDKAILHNVNLFLPAASTIALVGENGAGKTTLVKLLCRFYDPVEGRILLDGVDLKRLDPEEWRERAGVAFQDFIKFQLIAREAVGVGDLGAVDNLARVGAATSFARADEVIERLPSGFDTQLGRTFEGGTDLSDGEWQRVALARGAMRQAPVMLILDEPTASLDARAEHEVFEKFAEMARPGKNHRPITLLVSHRFSTVRMADLIVVMDAGRVEDVGSHQELVSRGGRYAELFRLQASRYD